MIINEKFASLSQEKQMEIINAGLECFGQYGYKKANTEQIALKAGISKGLLFYYFRNKKTFYFFPVHLSFYRNKVFDWSGSGYWFFVSCITNVVTD